MRLENRILKVPKGIAVYNDMYWGDLLEGMCLTFYFTHLHPSLMRNEPADPQTSSCGRLGLGQSKWKNLPRGASTRS